MFDEKDIVRRCIKNERKAQRLLYEHYARGLLAVCMQYTGNRFEAEDILQDGFVKVFKNLKSFEGRSSLGSWMRRIMINTAITRYHKDARHQHHYDIDELKEKNIGDCELPEVDFNREELMQVIDNLPKGYRMVFNLYAIEGYKHREIAEMLEIDENTSKSQYSRAKSLIRCRLSEMAKEKPGK